jgi:hypothetical protein
LVRYDESRAPHFARAAGVAGSREEKSMKNRSGPNGDVVQEIPMGAYDDAELLGLEREFDAGYAEWETAFEAAGFGSSNVTEAAGAVLDDIVERLLGTRAKTVAGLRVKFKVWRHWIGGRAEWDDGSEAAAVMRSLWSDVNEMAEASMTPAGADGDAAAARSTLHY